MSPAPETVRRCDTLDMVLVHRVFRREFTVLPALVRAVPDRHLQRVQPVAEHARELLDTLHHHHTGEDDLLWPKLAVRAPLDLPLVERMQHQHAAVGALVTAARPLLSTWSSTGDIGTGHDLAALLEEMATHLVEHLDDEERDALPLVEQYVTESEWAEVADRGMASMPKSQLVVFLAYILEETTPAERAHFLRQVPLPGRIAYHLVGKRKHRAESRQLRGALNGRRTDQQ